jgi:sortase A
MTTTDLRTGPGGEGADAPRRLERVGETGAVTGPATDAGTGSETELTEAQEAPTEAASTPHADLRESGEAPGSREAAPRDPEEEARHQRRHRRLLTASTWVMCIGALIILFGAWQLWGTAIEQAHSQNDLASQWAAKVHHARPTFTLAGATTNVPVPPEGNVLALLQIPAIGLSQFVVEGTGTDDLAKGPGHYGGTAAPGQSGNVAIAGHRTTHGAPFYNISALKPGDVIYLTDLASQKLTYVVAFPPFPVDPSNVSVLNYFGDNRLTLTSCNPPYSAAQRLIVVAGFKGNSLHHTLDAGRPYNVALSGEAGWNTGLLPLVLLEVALLVFLGLTNRRWARILGRESKWLILVPIWAALVYLLFGTLSNFLPAAA